MLKIGIEYGIVIELSRRNKKWFSLLSTVLEHSRVVFSTYKSTGTLDCISCSKIFLCAENSSFVLKNSSGHAEPLFIALIAICV